MKMRKENKMQVKFSDFETTHCNYCANNGTEICTCCSSPNGYIGVPSSYYPSVEWGNSYFRLLEEYSKLLYNMGFEVTR